jgi:single-strand DNA-binding protein
MSSLNKVTLIGRVGKDPEINKTQAGKTIASLSIATSESWKDKNTGEKREKTEWHKVVVYNENIAKVVQNYVKKGNQIYIEGALQTRKWQDKDSKDRYTTEVILQDFKGQLILLAGGKPDNSEHLPTPSNNVADELDDDIPF